MVVERTFCRICQAYCGLEVELDDDVITRVRADREHPVSKGYSCVKGRALAELHADPRRLVAHRLNGAEAPSDLVIGDLASELRRIINDHGPDAVGFYRGTASYFDSAGLVGLGALISGIGSRSLYTTSTIDQVARFWVAELMCGMFSALPLIDQEHVRLTILAGTNPPVSHGHVNSWPDPVSRLRRLAARGEIWCLDVRSTETTAIAGNHLAPRPGTDWAVLGHLVRELLDSGADTEFLEAHGTGVNELREAVQPLDRSTAAQVAGLAPEQLDDLVAAVRRARKVAVQTGTGTTMAKFGDVTEWMAWALMGVTGSLDRAGGVWFSPGLLRPRRTPGSPASEPGPVSRPDVAGRFGERPTAALVDEIEAGNIRALIVIGGNPLRAVPGSGRLVEAFATLDVLAVADVLATATVESATHVLACAAQFERPDVAMVETMYPVPASQYSPALLPPRGDARQLYELLSELSSQLDIVPPAPDAERLFDTLAGSRADALRTERIVLGEPELGWFTDQILPDGRWSLAPAPLVRRLSEALATRAENSGTLLLTPRRQIGHMNTLLAGRSDRPDLLISPTDALALDVSDGTIVEISAGSSTVEAAVRVEPGLRSGVVSLPHGYDAPNIADLTTDTDSVHPDYGMPTLAGVPVTIIARR